MRGTMTEGCPVCGLAGEVEPIASLIGDGATGTALAERFKAPVYVGAPRWLWWQGAIGAVVILGGLNDHYGLTAWILVANIVVPIGGLVLLGRGIEAEKARELEWKTYGERVRDGSYCHRDDCAFDDLYLGTPEQFVAECFWM